MQLTEKNRTGGFILSEANGNLSRETVTLLTGSLYEAGTILGVVTTGGKYTAHNPAASDGTEVAAAILYGPVDAREGDRPGVVIIRLAEVIKDELVWPAGISEPNKAAALADLAPKYLVAR